MNIPNLKAFINELRVTTIPKIKGYAYNRESGGMCALGIAQTVAKIPFNVQNLYITVNDEVKWQAVASASIDELCAWFQLTPEYYNGSISISTISKIWRKNDTTDLSFSQIADWLEEEFRLEIKEHELQLAKREIEKLVEYIQEEKKTVEDKVLVAV
jgi:hypothetical protein